jgi:hypothetical protein
MRGNTGNAVAVRLFGTELLTVRLIWMGKASLFSRQPHGFICAVLVDRCHVKQIDCAKRMLRNL